MFEAKGLCRNLIKMQFIAQNQNNSYFGQIYNSIYTKNGQNPRSVFDKVRNAINGNQVLWKETTMEPPNNKISIDFNL